MLNPESVEQMRKFEEAATMMVDHYPRIWWQLYNNSIKEGFSESQALDLVKAFILRPLG